MSTRACIARKTNSGFAGRYHHWDGYPSGLGATLWNLWRNEFEQDTKKMLKVLVDDHPAGWSTINDANWDEKPGFNEYGSRSKPTNRPQCYCHGDRAEGGYLLTHDNASGSGCEWAYAFDGYNMTILSSYTESGSKMIGAFGVGDPNGNWKVVAEIDLRDDEEPDWERMTDLAYSGV